MTATNPCGGSATQTATLHILGTIEAPDNGLAINSVYFPTNRPRRVSAKAGLLDSQQTTLNFIADSFKQYLQNKPDARLTVTGHADKRGTADYNRELSQKRADVAKAYLVAQGVPEDHIDTQAAGDDQNLTADQVKELVEQNPNLSDEERQKVMEKMKTLVYANNRRVDLMLSPNGRESVRQYPFKAADYATLIDRNAETGSGVQMASKREKAEN
jgi:outer membrane protein OmpA-like peptidoglycan-associated protein